MTKLSLLDLAHVTEGGDVATSLANAADIARHAESLGFERYWCAEHHGMEGIASAATSVVIGHVAAATSTIRVGAGGIMLPNHSPLVIAEQFGTLEALFPGRIDLGLGRAPGSDQRVAAALRRNLDTNPDAFPRDVVELQSYLAGDGRTGIKATPGAGAKVPLYILGSSLFGAQVAAVLGLPYAFASHFAPQALDDALAICEHLREAIAGKRMADQDGTDGSRAALLDPELLRRLERTIEQAERRVTRLIAELGGLPNEDALRTIGDLILARFSEIPSGVTRVSLEDFEGNGVVVELDPALAPHANASAYYDRAGKATRARARLPSLIANTESGLTTLRSLVERAGSGDAQASEIEAAIPDDVLPGQRGQTERLPPYRRYRSSGGIEIRVGRGARHNDRLTFHPSAPTDIWLHARHTAGAHVILRWNGPGNPPARDLEEAAILAALHSKARTSGSAPVDWTLRKYVRKPRGAKPGSVLPDRVRTLFVEPDERVLETLNDADHEE